VALAIAGAATVVVLSRDERGQHGAVGITPKPATSATASTTTTAPLITYQVKRGDTLTSIAKRFGVPISAIVAINHLSDPDRLAEGQSLLIPPVPPVQLVISPPNGTAGQAFDLKLTGAKQDETVTFEIDYPGGKFTGPPHTVSADGTVTASYQTSFTQPPGAYTVIAHGNQGSTAQATFRVDATPTAPTISSP
jgi:LysM repeat protein